MQHSNTNKYYFSKFCIRLLCVLSTLLVTEEVVAQSCECTDCGNSVGPLTSMDFEFLAEGAINNDLSNAGQGICGIIIDFVPDHIWSVEMILTSPGGQSITLIGDQSFQIGVTGPQTWSINFTPCGEAAAPDPGFSEVWDNNQNWLLANAYSGTYYPHNGCLEDFNTGPVDGNWTLTVGNSHPLSSVEIIDITIIFCDDEGMGCFACAADAGVLNMTKGVMACAGDSSLIFDLDPVYSGLAPDTNLYNYTYLISHEDTVIAYEDFPDLRNYDAGEYFICGLSYLGEDSLDLPPANNSISLDSFDILLLDSISLCAARTGDCFRVFINESETILIVDTICLGDTLFYDTLVLDQTGVYQLDYTNESNCDSTIIIDLTVQAPFVNNLRDTVCVDEPYFFNDMWLEASGNFRDTLLTTTGCDSFINLRFIRLDSILVNYERTICHGDSVLIGDVYYDSTGVFTTVLETNQGCDSTIVLDLTVLNPAINIESVQDLNCNNSSVLIDASNSVGEALMFQWTDLDFGGTGIINGEMESILEVILPGNYLLTLTDTLDESHCSIIDSVFVNIDFSTPQINISGDTINCLNPPVQILTDTITYIENFSWTGPNGFTSTEEDPWINDPGEYDVLVSGSNGCLAFYSIMIEADTIAPEIIEALVSDTLSCDVSLVQFFADANPNIISYNWTGPNSFDFDIPNPTTSLSGDYTLTVESVNGCVNDTTITVLEDFNIPGIQIQADELGCLPDTIQLFSSSTIDGSSFDWTGPNSYTSSNQNPFVFEVGTYDLTVTAPNGCINVESVNITANIELPTITVIGDTLGCAPDTIQVQSFSSIGNSTFTWSGPNGFSSDVSNPLITEVGIYGLTVVAPNGCIADTSLEIIANTEQAVITIIGDTLGCLPDTIILESFSNINGSQFSWLGPNGFVSNQSNPEVTEPGIYDLEVLAPNGCTSTASYEVEIDDELPIVTIISDTLNCAPDTIVLQSFSSIAGSAFSWTGPNGFSSIQSNPEVTQAGDYTLLVTSPNGCASSSEVTVIADAAVPIVSIVGDTLGCSPDTILLAGFSNIVGSEFSWTGPNGFSSLSSTSEVTEGGIYDLTVLAPNGCESTASYEVLVDDVLPLVNIIGDTLGCAPDTITLQSFSNINNSVFSWTGPNGFTSNESNPSVTEAGVYDLTVLAPNGCTTMSSILIESDEEIPFLIVIGDTLGCAPDTIQVQSFSSIGNSTFAWTGPNGFSSDLSNPLITEVGIYGLTVVAPNGCIADTSLEIIADTEQAVITIIGDTLGCLPDTIILESSTNINGSQFSWLGPNGFSSSQSNPEVYESGIYDLEVLAPNGCTSTASYEVEIDDELPIVTIISDTLNCAPDTIVLQSFSSIAGSAFSWTGPNGFSSIQSNPEVTQAGDYILLVTSPNGCASSSEVTVIADAAVPIVSIVGDTLGCSPDTIFLAGFSNILGSEFSWTGPNGFSSLSSTPEVTEGGIYDLTVLAPNGCESTASYEVLVDDVLPLVNIIGDTLGCAPDTITLQSFSNIDNSIFNWTGPNGFTSNESNPSVTESGVYDLTVLAPNGCTTMSSILIESDEEIPFLIVIGDTLGCAPDTVQVQSFSSIGSSTFTWTGPNGFSSDVSNPLITEVGIYDLTVFAPNGCVADTSLEIIANTEQAVITIIGDTLGCLPDTIILESSTSINGSQFSWLGPNGFASNQSNPEIYEPGIYDLEVLAPNGCTSIASYEVAIDDKLPMITIISDTLNCAPDTIVLQSFSSIAGSEFSWTGPNGFSSIQSNPEVTQAGDYILLVTSPNGCASSSEVTVIADAAVPIVSIVGDTLGCSPDTILLAGFSNILGSEFSWTGPNGFSSLSSTPEVTEGGIYDLTVLAPNGCESTASYEVLVDDVLPLVNIIGDTLGCAPDTIQVQSFSNIDNSIFSWTGPNGFTSNESNPSVTESGVYDLTVLAPNGCTTMSSILIESDEEIPFLIVIGDTLGCAPDTVQVQSFSSIGNSTFTWTGPNGFSSDVSNPLITEVGIYDLTVLAPNGCIADTSLEIIANTEQAVITIIGDTLGCLPDTIILESFSNINGSQFSWLGPNGFVSNQSNPEVTEPGIYDLEVLAPNGCTSTASYEVAIDDELPMITIISDTLNCAPDTIVLQSFSSIAGSEFSWTGPNGFESNQSNPEVFEPGIYDLLVTAPNGCENTNTYEVAIDDESPLIMILGDTINCLMDTITLQSSSNLPGSTFEWTGPNSFSSDLQNPLITETGTYVLAVTAPNACISLDSFEVNSDLEIPMLETIGDTIDCTNDLRQLQSLTNINNAIYHWQGPNGFEAIDANPIITQAGVYTLTITGENGCSNTSVTELLDLSEALMAFAIVTDTLDCDMTNVLIDGTNSSDGNSINYSWLDFNNVLIGDMENIIVNAPGTYTLIVNDISTACYDTTQVQVMGDTVAPIASINILGEQSITCDNTFILLSADGSSPMSDISINWFFNTTSISNLSEIEIQEAGEYILEITNLLNACTDTDTIIIDQNTDLPSIEILPPPIINCLDSIVLIDATNSSSGFDYDYEWTSLMNIGIVSGQNELSLQVDEPGTYTLTILNTLNGCIDSASVLVEADLTYPIALANVEEDLDCFTQSLTLDGTESSMGPFFDYQWTGGNILSGSTTLSPIVNQTGTYTLVISNSQNGCTASTEILLEGNDNFISGAAVITTDPSCYEENDGSILIESVAAEQLHMFIL